MRGSYCRYPSRTLTGCHVPQCPKPLFFFFFAFINFFIFPQGSPPLFLLCLGSTFTGAHSFSLCITIIPDSSPRTVYCGEGQTQVSLVQHKFCPFSLHPVPSLATFEKLLFSLDFYFPCLIFVMWSDFERMMRMFFRGC